ncbi:MAG: aldehyde dehydrogenase [Frankiales bacterium]|nr:aldehyde dehydrogenase [Frankiales bacterium]
MARQWNSELFIDGKWVSDEDLPRIEVINPANEELIGSVPEATPKTAIRALEAARRAFDEGPWPWMKPAERAALLVKMAEIFESKGAELTELMVAQTGSPVNVTDFVQGVGSIGMLRSNAEQIQSAVQWVENVGNPTGGPLGVNGQALFKEPIGVVAAITPFNFPFMLNMVKMAPALAAGCTVVLKPHPWTPLDAFLIARVAEEAGIPPGVFNVITGGGAVGDELTSSPLVDMVTFTGSTATGRRIMASAAETIKRVQLELGGKSAQVVLGDAGEDYARSIGFGAVLAHCGQGCVLQTRLLLPTHLLEAYRSGVDDALAAVTIGDPADPATTLGPLIREQQRARVEGLVQSGLDEGAELVTGGKRPDSQPKGFFYEPTIMIGENSMRIAQEEIFGPVLTVIPYSGEDDDAVRIANDSLYGLGGGVVAQHTGRAFNVARQIRAGLMSAQGVATDPGVTTGAGQGQGPGWGSTPKGIAQEGAFGGFKQSGLGREWGHHGIEDFLEVKNIAWS